MDMITTAARHPVDTSAIPGWATDADPANDPTYPMRDRVQDDVPAIDWKRPSQQQPDVEILQSIEHNRLPAVVGTAVPPSGLSGMIRRAAFRYSESHWGHWLMLLAADRINVVEGVVQDLGRGRIPNIPGEMGVRAEWRHNKAGFARKAAATALVTAVLVAWLRPKRNKVERPRGKMTAS